MTRAVTRMLLLALCGMTCILIAAVPLQPGIPEWPVPDMLLVLCSYWVLRRPEGAPLLLIFLLGLTADLVLMRPVGIGALSMVLITELLRSQGRSLRDVPFVVEWLTVSVLIAAGTTLQMMLVWLSLGTLPTLSEVAIFVAVTALSYPLVALICATLLGLRHKRTGQLTYSTYLGEG